MASFRVGQRVRIVRSTTGLTTGREATITSELIKTQTPEGEVYEGHRIDIDGFGDRSDRGILICSPPDWLEPLQPARNRIVAWESLPIDPRKVLEGVS